MNMTTAKKVREIPGYTRVRVLRRRREPRELAPPFKAIRNFCLEYTGYNDAEVTRCTSPKCWLFPLRFGKWPEPYQD